MMIRNILLALLFLPFSVSSQEVEIRDTTGYILLINVNDNKKLSNFAEEDLELLFLGNLTDTIKTFSYKIGSDFFGEILNKGAVILPNTVSLPLILEDSLDYLYDDFFNTHIDIVTLPDSLLKQSRFCFKWKKYYYEIWIGEIEMSFFEYDLWNSKKHKAYYPTNLRECKIISLEDETFFRRIIYRITKTKKGRKCIKRSSRETVK